MIAREHAMAVSDLPVAVIGAGPVGLAAAAHLLARGERPLVLEAGAAVASSVRQWAHVRMFSPWAYNIDRSAAALLRAAGWRPPDDDAIPTGGELVAHYLEPLAALPALRHHIHLGSRVMAISRKGHDKVKTEGRSHQPFVIRVAAPDGRERVCEARAVIDASGTWATPNPAGADGLAAFGEAATAARITYGIPDVLGAARVRHAGRSTLVIGSGHSALNVLIDLARLRQSAPATRILWATRRADVATAFGGERRDALPARGALGSAARVLIGGGAVEIVAPFRVARIEQQPDDRLSVTGERSGAEASVTADEVVVATGFRPDFTFLREVRLSLDPWLESSGTIGPLIDPNLHSCGTVRPHGAAELAHAEPDFFIAGMKSYGRAPTFLLATGHEQVRSIVAALSGDHAGARAVELILPETGVCRTQALETAVASACCGGPPQLDTTACCRQDERAKAAGAAGCGCGSAGG
jgi:thioredoxin reductase